MLVLGLHSEGGEQDVEGNKEKVPVRIQWVLTLGRVCGIGVDGAVDGGANGDAVAKEEGVDDGKDEADRSGYNGSRLQFQGGAQDKLW